MNLDSKNTAMKTYKYDTLFALLPNGAVITQGKLRVTICLTYAEDI